MMCINVVAASAHWEMCVPDLVTEVGLHAAETEEQSITRQLTKALEGVLPEFDQAQTIRSFPPAKFDALSLDDLLSPSERAVRDRVREFAVSGKAPGREGGGIEVL